MNEISAASNIKKMLKLHFPKWDYIHREGLKKMQLFLLAGIILRSVKEFLQIRGKQACFRVETVLMERS